LSLLQVTHLEHTNCLLQRENPYKSLSTTCISKIYMLRLAGASIGKYKKNQKIKNPIKKWKKD
jgi:hypothetical protein